MSEDGAPKEAMSFRTEVGVERMTQSLNELFGVEEDRPGQIVLKSGDFTEPNLLKARLETFLLAGLECMRAYKDGEKLPKTGVNKRDFFTGKVTTQLERDQEVNKFEMALGVVKGERADSEQLVRLVGEYGEYYYGFINEEQRQKLEDAPTIGMLWWSRKSPYEVDNIKTDFGKKSQRVKDVVSKVVELAPAWARKE